MISTVIPTGQTFSQTIIGTRWWTNVIEATANELIAVLGKPNADTEWHLIAKDDESKSTYIVTLYMSFFPINHNERFRWHIGTKDYRQSIDFQRWLNEQLTDKRKTTQQKYKFADCDITFPDGTFQEHLIFKLNHEYVDEQEDDQVFYYADNYEHLLELCTEDSKETFRITTINKLYEEL